jgi:hypothetical protein
MIKVNEVWRQLFREFKWLLLAAIIVAVGYPYFDNSENWILSSIKIFFPTLFFISWFSSQYLRVKKQLHVENALNDVSENVNRNTQELIGHITGGNSYYYYKIGEQISPTFFLADCVYIGDYTLLDNEIFFLSKNSNYKDQRHIVPSLNKTIASAANAQLMFEFKDDSVVLCVIVFTCKGKKWSQIMYLRRINDEIEIKSDLTLPDRNVITLPVYRVGYTQYWNLS